MAPNVQQKVRLRCDDSTTVEIKKAAAMKSVVLAACLDKEVELHCAGEPIPVPGVELGVLKKVVDFCEHHAGVEWSDSDYHLNPRAWRQDPFDDRLMDVDLETRFALLHAANFLNIKELRALCCRTGKHDEREVNSRNQREFNVKNDYTAQEDQAVRAEVAWDFQNDN